MGTFNFESESQFFGKKREEEPEMEFNEIDPKLLNSGEDLDRASPELWPELIPGVERFSNLLPSTTESNRTEETKTKLKEKRVKELSSMTEQQLIAQIKTLKERAYRIGLEEAREVERGKMLNIFGDFKHP